MTEIRRSNRTRHQTTSIYDEAKKEQEEKLRLKNDKDHDEEEEEDDDEDLEEEEDEEEEEEEMQDDESAAGSQSTLSRPKRQSLDQDASDDNEDNDDDNMSKTSNNDGNESDPAEFTTTSRHRRSPSQKKASPSATSKSKGSKKSGKSRGTTSLRNTSSQGHGKSTQSAIQSLAKKVLVADELKDPSHQSLVASLLLAVGSSSRKHGKNEFHSHGRRAIDVEDFLSRKMSCYTDALFAIARDVVALYNSDPNRAQVRIINLLFRSVGGTKNSELDEDKVMLEEMGNDEWGDVVTDLVDDMKYTPESCVLFCSDPDGAVHYSAVLHSIKDDLEKGDEVQRGKGSVTSLQDIPVTASSLGVREYRKIYQEFWYVLGHVALMEGGMSSSASVVPFTEDEIDDSSDESEGDANKTSKQKKTSKTSKEDSQGIATRFDTEVVRDILSRLVELVSVGQPDIRAAASTAVYSMGQAILDKTVRLSEKLQIVTRQFAAAVGGKGKKTSSAKAESLRFQIDCLRRTRETLDEIIEALVIKGVFIHRYRDSNMFNRASSIHALADMAIRRPDVFLKDKYLKYFGWMLSDKAECVRIAALDGLNRPFEETDNTKIIGQETSIDLSHLENVSTKFLKRISETVIDVHSSVQERGVKLMLSLLRAGFLDDVDDEQMWNQVNILAFETDSTPAVRRDALYFIMEQLEEFDEGDDKSSKKRKSLDNPQPSDKKAAQRLDAIASWAAHTLTDGNVPLDKIQIGLVSHLVHSLRDMPDHKDIITNWNAMIRAITDEKIATTSQGNAAGAKADLAKQRVLVEILVCAARSEVESVTENDFMVSDLDPIFMRYSSKGSERKKSSKRNSATSSLSHESLSVALIKSLPNLLEKFKSDSKILESLTSLPRYFVPSVFTLPQRKNDFVSLLKTLMDIYLLSTDEGVLRNCARSIRYLSEGNHARSNEAINGVKKLVGKVRDNILHHISEGKDVPTGLSETSNDIEEQRKMENETSLYLGLLRARILSWMCIFCEYLDDDIKCEATEELFIAVADGLAHRLASFNVTSRLACDDESNNVIVETWIASVSQSSKLTTRTVDEALQFLLSVVAQKVYDVQHDENLIMSDDQDALSVNGDDDHDDIVDDHLVLRLRDRLISLVESCFQHFLDMNTKAKCSPAQISWSASVQKSAGDVASDLRTLFPREWSNASSPLLRSFAITDDSRLIGGYVRFLHVIEEEQANKGSPESKELHPVLLSIGRAVVANWKLGNRREAGVLLTHISSSNMETSEMIKSLCNLLKAIQPVRFLEAQMASLRQSYENWIDSDPADIDDENPTDEMMANFEQEELNHKKAFENILQQANLFAESLGFKNKTRLTDAALVTALVGFVKEGIRFSFSNSEEFMLGSRLSFLSILVSYAKYIKMNPEHNRMIREYIEERELNLRSHEDFEEVHEDDLSALADFRKALGLGESTIMHADGSTTDYDVSFKSSISQRSAVTPNSRADSATSAGRSLSNSVKDVSMSTPATSAARKSGVSSAGSIRSIMSSVQGSLSPLYEEGNDEESEESETFTPGAGSKRSLFGGSTRSRQSGFDSSANSKRSRFDNSVNSKLSGYESTADSQLIYSKSQTTLEIDQSDLESPHK
mmetsp:Transcript_4325/g.8293  ORF Transcript_4325/g.8293 Transcript_4325/m.8293 type:complete len:1621 (+) Transcript_4325:123-4985(+)|eukprot:CAMPEP_0176490844 /NCGR_PEP_ID=MMETSP0200_2-20121128/8100_1 /TAXON_ID=947934 /ORGANISM="Chaetoceros sp., Strain GSL56" /LENGTH=1620 /DNA_ID=CAMNT_0017888203 /DNA_START=104 /DNA_END=4966 /DNA_ORIENTATION=-